MVNEREGTTMWTLCPTRYCLGVFFEVLSTFVFQAIQALSSVSENQAWERSVWTPKIERLKSENTQSLNCWSKMPQSPSLLLFLLPRAQTWAVICLNDRAIEKRGYWTKVELPNKDLSKLLLFAGFSLQQVDLTHFPTDFQCSFKKQEQQTEEVGMKKISCWKYGGFQ